MAQRKSPSYPEWPVDRSVYSLFCDDFCLSRSHYTDIDPTNRERAATAGIESGTYNIDQQVKNLNDCILKAAKETIPRGARKNYRPYWTAELQEMEDMVETARVEAEQHPTVQNNVHLKASEAKCKKAYTQAARSSWRQKINELNMDRDGKKDVESPSSYE